MAFLNESGLTRYDGKLKGLIAGAYSASATYDVGDYCIHGGSLYKCTTAIAAAEAWTSGHWTKINLADEIDAAKEDLEKLKLDVADAYSASDAHAVGDYVVRNSVLYRCTTAIGSGGETWNAAHWTTVNIGDELVAIKAGIDLLEEDLADEYSSSSTYAVGDYCMKDGVLYRCTTAISTAEAWTSGHWTAAQVGDELCDLQGSLNAMKPSQIEIYPNASTPWANPNTIIGFQASGGIITLSTADGLGFSITSGGGTSGWKTVGAVATGYRPSNYRYTLAYAYDGTGVTATYVCRISAAGSIQIMALPDNVTVYFNITYIAA